MTTTLPKPIGVLLPTYNGERHLEACLRSVLRQEGVEFEVWVSDDGSTDGTKAILKKFTDPRIRILPSSHRGGLFQNLNRLIRASQNPYFQILCQDDMLEPLSLFRSLQRLSRFPRAGLCFSKAKWIDSQGRITGLAALYDLPNTIRPELALQHFFYHGCIPGNLSTVAVRRTAVMEVGGFDETYRVSGDYDLWSRITERWDMLILHEHLVRVRLHPGQLSKAETSGAEFVSENRRIRERIVPNLPLSVQKRAKRFQRLRYGVLDFHYAARSAVRGYRKNAWRVWKSMGFKEAILSAASWLVTVNNRAFRPRAGFVLPADYHVGP